jgi:hypothetical protein
MLRAIFCLISVIRDARNELNTLIRFDANIEGKRIEDRRWVTRLISGFPTMKVIDDWLVAL